jgi:hypothetical protein
MGWGIFSALENNIIAVQIEFKNYMMTEKITKEKVDF